LNNRAHIFFFLLLCLWIYTFWSPQKEHVAPKTS